jgi:uncharacterized membrane protein YdfJ with MMPL/SSD domain
VPLVAVVMNLLAVGAAYGPVAVVFQWGWWPADLIGSQPGPVESFAPVMLFAVLIKGTGATSNARNLWMSAVGAYPPGEL